MEKTNVSGELGQSPSLAEGKQDQRPCRVEERQSADRALGIAVGWGYDMFSITDIFVTIIEIHRQSILLYLHSCLFSI